MRSLLIALATLVACSSDSSSDAADDRSTQAQCDQLAGDIRKAAEQRGLQAAGVCVSEDAQIKKDFGESCKALKDCNDHCCK